MWLWRCEPFYLATYSATHSFWRSCSSRKSMYSFLSPNWTNASAYRWVWSLVATADYRSTTVTHTHTLTHTHTHTHTLTHTLTLTHSHTLTHTHTHTHSHSHTHRFSLHLVQFGVEQLQLTVPLLQCPLQSLYMSSISRHHTMAAQQGTHLSLHTHTVSDTHQYSTAATQDRYRLVAP